jgi:coenzyme F420-0:L-glutamate ligase/coenzyme F420-1:gamma-L-glutamate ligase
MSELRVVPVEGVGEVAEGDDLASLLVDAAGRDALVDGDVVVVAHKVVSKAEGRIVAGADRREIAQRESVRILRRSGDTLISETRHGFVCANAGVDASNVEGDRVALLPLDPDLSARRIRTGIQRLTGAEVAVIVSDTFGRPWRLGQTNVAIGIAGLEPFIDYRGTTDGHGNQLAATLICVADEIAGAAELVMAKTKGICAAIVRGLDVRVGSGRATDVVRPHEEDLFR